MGIKPKIFFLETWSLRSGEFFICSDVCFTAFKEYVSFLGIERDGTVLLDLFPLEIVFGNILFV